MNEEFNANVNDDFYIILSRFWMDIKFCIQNIFDISTMFKALYFSYFFLPNDIKNILSNKNKKIYIFIFKYLRAI